MLTKDKMIFLLIFCLPGVSLGLDVHQSPTDIFTKPGDKVEISCSHNKTDFFQMLWYQQPPGETAMKLIGYLYYSDPTMEATYKGLYSIAGDLSGSGKKNVSLMIQVVGLEQGAVYYCAASKGQNYEAYFGRGTKLTVLEKGQPVTPPTVKILPPSEKECRNKKDKKRKKTLVCVASGFYPDHVSVSWEKNGKVVPDSEAKDRREKYGVATDSAAKRVGEFYRITSRLRVPAAHYNTPGNTFTCLVSFYNGAENILRHASIDSIKDESEAGMTREKYLKHTQSAKLSYGVLIVKSCIYGAFIGFLVWKLQGSSGKHNN